MDALLGFPATSLLAYSAAALAAVAVMVIGTGLGLHLDLKLRRFYLPAVTFMIVVVPPFGVALSGRDVTDLDFDKLGQLPGLTVWFYRLSSLALVGLSAVRLISHVLAPASESRGAGSLLVAFVAYFVCNFLLNGVFGTVPSLPDAPVLYAALLLLAVYASRETSLDSVIVAAKCGLLLVMIASLALLATDPGLVRQVVGAQLRLPGVPFRLYGLGANPNSIATLAVVSLLLSIHRPFRMRTAEAANLAVTLAVLLLAQSQTGWVVALLSSSVLIWNRAGLGIFERRFLLVAAVLTVAAAVGMLVLVSTFGAGLSPQDMVSGDRYREITTLTGRVRIWQAAIVHWQDNLFFGYGPEIWGSAFRDKIGMGFAFTAHNQFLHALSSAGLVGLVALIGYAVVLCYLSLTTPRPVRGLALALLSLIGVQFFTETPLHIVTPYANEFLPQFLLFSVLACAHFRGHAQGLQRGAAVPVQPYGLVSSASDRRHAPDASVLRS